MPTIRLLLLCLCCIYVQQCDSQSILKVHCTDGWLYNETFHSCYKIFKSENVAYDEAFRNCENQGAKLTNLQNPTEQEFMRRLILQQAVTGSEWDGLYIALTDRGRELHDFQWDGWPGVFDGNPEYWAPYQPDDKGKEDCVQILIDKISPSFGKLNDAYCESIPTTKGFICKMQLECSLSNKNGGDIFETGHEVFDCTNTTCPLDGSQHVWRIDLGKDTAVSGLTIERRVKECKPSWELIGSKCYKFIKAPSNYESAVSACRHKGAVLASLIDRNHQTKIIDLVKKQFRLKTNWETTVWLGGQDIVEEGRWVWTYAGNQPLATDLEWLPNQPDDWKGTAPTGEDCLVLHVVDLIGKLNDVHYTFTADGYICEQHILPPHNESAMEIHGDISVIGTSMPTLLYQGQIPTCDGALNVCEKLTIPLISNQRIRYVYISTTTCLKPFVIETFAKNVCPLMPVSNAIVNTSTCLADGFCQSGTVLEYTCNGDYTITTPVTVCLANTSWSHPPTCLKREGASAVLVLSTSVGGSIFAVAIICATVFVIVRRRRQRQQMQGTETVTGRLDTTSDETELKEPAACVNTHRQPPEDGYLVVRESVQYEEVP